MADLSYYLSLPYTTVLKRDDEGDVVATIAELDGCMAHGGNEAEALANLREAQATWLEHAISGNQSIPLPEPEEELPSGKFVVRLPRSLHLKLNRIARKENTSLNVLVTVFATEGIARREARMSIPPILAPLAIGPGEVTLRKKALPERAGTEHPTKSRRLRSKAK
jgi:antitoxin HicB